eukprot:2322233-Prymnesium_polylepis.1
MSSSAGPMKMNTSFAPATASRSKAKLKASDADCSLPAKTCKVQPSSSFTASRAFTMVRLAGASATTL